MAVLNFTDQQMADLYESVEIRSPEEIYQSLADTFTDKKYTGVIQGDDDREAFDFKKVVKEVHDRIRPWICGKQNEIIKIFSIADKVVRVGKLLEMVLSFFDSGAFLGIKEPTAQTIGQIASVIMKEVTIENIENYCRDVV